MQNQLGEGGFSGITLVLYFVFNWDVALMNYNTKYSYVYYRLEVTWAEGLLLYFNRYTSVSVFLKVFQVFEIQLGLKDDLFLVSLFAGVFVGIGLGIIFRYGGTTGGVDIIARLVFKYKGWSMGKTMFIFDALLFYFPG